MFSKKVFGQPAHAGLTVLPLVFDNIDQLQTRA